MYGIATKQFAKQQGTLPWKQSHSDFSWDPHVLILWEIGALTSYDLLMAETLLGPFPPEEQKKYAPLLCHLTKSTREGHLCILLEEDTLRPAPQETWLKKLAHADHTAAKKALARLPFIEAWHSLPSSLASKVQRDSPLPETPLCLFENALYLQRFWRDETLFLKNYQKLTQSVPTLTPNQSQVHNLLKQKQEQGLLLQEQANAISHACENSCTFIVGGPGTGKTYTAGILIQLFWQALSKEEQEKCEIALAAPTGKAASTLQRSLLQAQGNKEGPSLLQAETLHSLIGIGQRIPKLITADVVLVDESSMIDARLMSALFAALKPGARLILLGDPDQLPPVETGTLFADLVQIGAHKATLTTCLRAELKEIVTCAQTIRQGNVPSASEAVTIAPLDKAKLLETILPRYLYNKGPSLSTLQRFCVLSPLRKGPFGVNALNEAIAETLREHASTTIACPILITKNTPSQNLFNGEMGLLICHNPTPLFWNTPKKGDYALFPSADPQEPHRKIPSLLLPPFELAYALTVHKSQGSEFDRLLLLLPEGSETFGRTMLYTAVTRARKELTIWTQENTLEATIRTHDPRLSSLKKGD